MRRAQIIFSEYLVILLVVLVGAFAQVWALGLSIEAQMAGCLLWALFDWGFLVGASMIWVRVIRPSRLALGAWGMLAALSIVACFWDALGFRTFGSHLDFMTPIFWRAYRDVFWKYQLQFWTSTTCLVTVLIAPPLGAFWALRRRQKEVPRFVVSRRWAVPLLALLALRIGSAFLEPEMAGRYVSASLLGIFRPTPLPSATRVAESVVLSRLPTATRVDEWLQGIAPAPASDLPNLYLIIGESLRSDIVTPEIAGSLVALKEQSLPLSDGVAVTNYTHGSWAAIFNSRLPMVLDYEVGRRGFAGSPPIRALVRRGYELRIFQSANLDYYGMGERLFGDAFSLAARRVVPSPEKVTSPALSDRDVLDRLLEDVARKENRTGKLYLVFLDATHFDYTWPEDFQPKFTPFENLGVVIDPKLSPERLDRVRNAYWNSVAYFDHLVGLLRSKLEALDLWNGSLVLLVGDHGEEFLEEGRLVHASTLNDYQLRVPLLVKVPASIPKPKLLPGTRASQLDVLPTVLDVAGISPVAPGILQGRSLLRAGTSEPILSLMTGTSVFGELRGALRLSSPETTAELVITGGKLRHDGVLSARAVAVTRVRQPAQEPDSAEMARILNLLRVGLDR